MRKFLIGACICGSLLLGGYRLGTQTLWAEPAPRPAPYRATPTPTATHAPAAVVATPTPTATPHLTSPVGQSGHWQLQFTADFDGDGLNGNKWVTCYWWDDHGCTIAGNHELQWYQRDNLKVSDGSLHLQARREAVDAPDGRHFAYTSGMISSGRKVDDLSVPPKFTFQYGYVEMRAKVPRGQGLWSAFWLLPADQNSRPEIDIMELLGHKPGTVEMHFHYDGAGGKKAQAGKSWTGPDLSTDWHVFAVDWQPAQITWYVDGVERWHFSERAYIPDEPMYILANLAVGGDWPGAPNTQTPFPSAFLIDYIRVWQR